MKKMPKLILALFITSVSATAAAENNDSVTVHFNGTVTQPTCGFNTSNQQVTLEPIKASDIEKVSIGRAADTSSKNFQLKMNCSSRAEAEHIAIMLTADADAVSTNAITNAASKNGVGLELFTESGNVLALNKEIPQSSYLDRLNQGDDNLNYVVKYTRLQNTVSGGEVAGDAVFVVSYK